MLYRAGTPLWASNTDGRPVVFALIMQGDGNSVSTFPGAADLAHGLNAGQLKVPRMARPEVEAGVLP